MKVRVNSYVLNDIIKYGGTIEFLKNIRQISQYYSLYCKRQNLVSRLNKDKLKYLYKFKYHLKYLNCSFSTLKEIPYLPCLQVLICEFTKIAEIPFLPHLKILHCSYSDIVQIPFLPCLETLICLYTGIKKIPTLPCLKKLYCNMKEMDTTNVRIECEIFLY
jgi:Leucine-rich repeat (LRR) protein